MRARFVLFLAVAGMLTGLGGNIVVAEEPGATPVLGSFALGVGDEVFWHGPYIESGLNAICLPSNETCDAGCDIMPGCFTYELRLLGQGWRLRVAIGYPDLARPDFPRERYCLDFYDPGGNHVEDACTLATREVFLQEPAPGTWRVRVSAIDVTESTFRMRAKLESAPAEIAVPVEILPNLRAEPPYKFTFAAPAHPRVGHSLVGVFAEPPPAEAAGLTPVSCTADEVAEYQAMRCLRFMIGVQNAGEGPLTLLFSNVTDTLNGTQSVTQVVYSSDGSSYQRAAGTYSYHLTHEHYHYDDLYSTQLYKVLDDETGAMEPAGVSDKRGACLRDGKLVDWHRFYQGLPGSAPGNQELCSSNPASSDPVEFSMGLSHGWADIYPWYLPANFVDFGTNGDGRYVVQLTSDTGGSLLESNEADNVAYALISVVGNEVRILERGHGSSPWDPSKVVVGSLPTASGEAVSAVATRLTPAQFTDLSSDQEGPVVKWLWEFGDGTTSTAQHPSHQYAQLGSYPVKLSVTDFDLDKVTASVAAIVVQNIPPHAVGAADRTETDRLTPVRFQDQSTDPDGIVTKWLWDFGDGTTSSDQHPTHQYAQLGTFKVTLQAIDNDGGSGSTDVARVKVKNIPPAGQFQGRDAAVSLDHAIEANRVNPVAFEDLTTDADGSIVAWRWDFGDGASSEEQNPSHQYTQLGTFTARLTATDNDGGSGTSDRTVRVVNLLPTAAFMVDPAHPMVLALTDFLDASTDPDGEPAAWGWAFGDGDTAKGAEVSHRYLEGGWYDVRLSIADNDGGAAATTTRVYVCSPGGDAATLLDPSHVRLEFEACIHANPDEAPRLLPMGLADAMGGPPGLLWVLAAGAMVLRRAIGGRSVADMVNQRTTRGSRARVAALLAVVGMLVVAGPTSAGHLPDVPGDPDGPGHPGTRFYEAQTSRLGVVASIAPLASEAGLAVLDDGGNAIDAAVTTLFALGVVRPDTCGPGASGFLVYRGADGATGALDFWLKSPASMPVGMAWDGIGKALLVGHKVVGVPGLVAGMDAALERFGTISLAEAIAPAATLAEQGFEVTPELSAWNAASAPYLRMFPASAKAYLVGGVAPYPPGAHYENQDYARSLRLIAEQGPDAFYHGSIADQIDREMRENASKRPEGMEVSVPYPGDEGLLRKADLQSYRAVWRTPLQGIYRGHDIVTMPEPSSGGIALLENLNILEHYPVSRFGRSSTDHLHFTAESMKIAFADRAKYVADPDFTFDYDGDGTEERVPNGTLTSKPYATLRRGEIRDDQAGIYGPGAFGGDAGTGPDGSLENHTTGLVVMDARGNAVAASCTTGTQSTFGSAVVAGGTGFLLGGDLRVFSNAGTANQVEPEKRPRSTQTPYIVVRDGRVVIAGAGGGGEFIAMAAIQNVVNAVDFELDPARAVDAERLDIQGGQPDRDRILLLENLRIPVEVTEGLRARGHNLVPLGDYFFEGVMQAIGVTDESVRLATTDPRGFDHTLALPQRGDRGQNELPVADGSASAVVVDRVRPVHFTDRSTDPDGHITRWRWDFGDGKTSTDQHPSHLYKQLGTFDVSLTVWDDYTNRFSACCKSGASSSAHVATIEVRNIPPAGNFHGQGGGNGAASAEIEANRVEPVPFHDASTDADGEVVAWRWDFGDGATSDEQNPSHQYTQLGTFTVRLTATDNDGDSGSSERTVRVVNVLPTAAFKVDPAHPMVLALTDFLDASTDPDGAPASWGWAFGDGDTAKGAEVSHRYLEGGWYDVRLSIADNDGGTAVATTPVYVCSPGGDAATLLEPGHARLEFEACIHASPDEMPRLLPMGLGAGAEGLPGLLWFLGAGLAVARRRGAR